MLDYEKFIFQSHHFDPETGEISLVYRLENSEEDFIEFEEKLKIPAENIRLNAVGQSLLALHLAGGASYYKTCCPKQIEVRSGILNDEQAAFWTDVYENGLGEFFYRNEIDFRGLVSFPVQNPGTPVFHQSDRPSTGRTLIPVGGGKDSVVTIELLRKDETKDITLLRMGSHPLIDELVSISGLPCITVERSLDPKLFELNEQGALNGHVPISAYLSCVATIVAEAIGFDEIVMSNEKSASSGNVQYLGKEINHQWSKSDAFEIAFNDYIRQYINKNLRYYSRLRALSELQIAEEFCKFPQYFDCVTSCNTNWKILSQKSTSDRWCGTCPKCTFVFALLAANLSKDTVLRIFGKNIFEDASTEQMYKRLLGEEGFKPFECVGTPEETSEAFAKIKQRGEFADTAVMQALDSAIG